MHAKLSFVHVKLDFIHVKLNFIHVKLNFIHVKFSFIHVKLSFIHLKLNFLHVFSGSSDLFTFVDTVPLVDKAPPDTRTEIIKGLQPEIKQAVPPSQIKNLQTQMVVNGLTEELDLTPVI